MKQKSILLLPVILLATALMPACKAKKIVQPAPVAQAPVAVAPKASPAPAPAPVAAATPVPATQPVSTPNYNFTNIQFEFNSGILKTESYPAMDRAVAEMKKDRSVKFLISGNASAEGTAEHNMALSVERANAVKTYLVNSGISPDNLSAKGNGESVPIADNTTEAGKALNRRVEIKKAD